MKKVKAYPETHMVGYITVENVPDELRRGVGMALHGDLGIQIAEDGRIWVCINGIAFLRFKPSSNSEMKPG
jgi:hypothetical protein